MHVEPHPLSILSENDFSNRLSALDAESDRSGWIAFPSGGLDGVTLVIFAGNLERFRMLSVGRKCACKVLYFQDSLRWWYDGSEILDCVDVIVDKFIRPFCGNDRLVLFGQSSGAYAALVAGTQFENAHVVACAPQTFPDVEAKHSIRSSPYIAVQRTPSGLHDIKTLWSKAQIGQSASVIISASEAGNPIGAHFWMDYLHALRLVDLPQVIIFIRASDVHAQVHRNAKNYSVLLGQLVEKSTSQLDRDSIVATQLDIMDAAHMARTLES